MRLGKEDYNKAVGILKRYNYNCLNIINTKADIMSLSVGVNDGMPKAKYTVSDSVCNKIIEIEENEELQRSIREYKIVRQALELVNEDSNYIFEELYQKGRNKWDIIEEMATSEETYKRRKRELIYAVDKEYKKLT